MDPFQRRIEELLSTLQLESVQPNEPVVVRNVPSPWRVLGTGNYAAVLVHPDQPERVVKVYAPGRPGLEEEAEVYRKLGVHPAYSACYYVGANYLVLKRLRGMTLWDCLRRGVRIPEQAIHDIDEALAHARRVGLNPRDVHAKNVMLHEGRGLVADISDFTREGRCTKWAHFKRAYWKVYRPLLYRYPVPVPGFLLDLIRRSYRAAGRLLASSD